MLKISKNIKKLALSLSVIGLAIGFQSYKNGEKTNINRATTYYALNADGSFYRLIGAINPADDCTAGPSLPCVIRYDDVVDPDGFAPIDRPGNGTNLGSNGYVPE